MGGSPPSAPTVVMPAPTAPTTYQSVVPLESYKQASDYLRRLTEKTEGIAQQRYQEVGTPAEIGARQAQRRVKEEAAYLAAVPQTDKYMTEITGATDRFGPVREAAKLGTTAATEDYLQALQRAEEKPKAITFETPLGLLQPFQKGCLVTNRPSLQSLLKRRNLPALPLLANELQQHLRRQLLVFRLLAAN